MTMPKGSSPYRSKLWNHVEEIRSLRFKRQSWRAIARTLAESHGLKVAPTTITRWFQRAAGKRWRVPLGFETARPKPKPVEPHPLDDPFSVVARPMPSPWTPVGRPRSVSASEAIVDEAEEIAIRTRQQTKARIIKPSPGTQL